MSAATALDREIANYLVQLNTRQKKAVLTVVKTFIEEQEQESFWKDKTFVAEMNRRLAELETNKVQGSTWEDVKQKVRKSIKPVKKK